MILDYSIKEASLFAKYINKVNGGLDYVLWDIPYVKSRVHMLCIN